MDIIELNLPLDLIEQGLQSDINEIEPLRALYNKGKAIS